MIEKKKALSKLDLHGCHEAEALEKLEARINDLKRQKRQDRGEYHRKHYLCYFILIRSNIRKKIRR